MHRWFRKPPVTPDFTRLAGMGGQDRIDVVPEDWQAQVESGNIRLFRTAVIGKLALNLSQGRHHLNAGHGGQDRAMWTTISQEEARGLAKADFVVGSQFRPGDAEALGALLGRDELDPLDQPTITYGLTLPAGDRRLHHTPGDTAYLVDRHVGFGVMDEHSRAALGELLQVELPTKK